MLSAALLALLVWWVFRKKPKPSIYDVMKAHVGNTGKTDHDMATILFVALAGMEHGKKTEILRQYQEYLDAMRPLHYDSAPPVVMDQVAHSMEQAAKVAQPQTHSVQLNAQRILFDYRDAKSQKTRRSLIANSMQTTPENHIIIEGHCMKRNDRRTFRIDRMSNIVLYDTGEVFDNGREMAEVMIYKTQAA